MSSAGRVLAPREVFLSLGAGAWLAALVVQVVGQDGDATMAATLALLAQGLICALLAHAHRTPRGARPSTLFAIALLSILMAPVAWFLGPNSGFGALVAFALLATGLLSGSARVPFPRATLSLVYVGLALSEALVFGAVVSGALPDRSLIPVLVGDHPIWHHVLAHAFLQGAFLVSMLAGRALRRRYSSLAASLARTSRTRARHEALVREARAEYHRTLACVQADVPAVLRGPRIDGVASRVSPHAPGSPRNLREHVAVHGPMRGAALEELVVAICDALDRLHARGLVHLALAPARVERSEEGWRLANGGATAEAYLAPEQLRGAAGRPADLHAAAAVIAFAVLGRDPYPSAAAVFGALPALPEGLASVLHRGLAKVPEDRFESAGALRRGMVAALAGMKPRPERMPPAISPPVEEAARGDAYRAKMRAFTLGVTGVCGVGAALLLIVAREPWPMRFAVLAMVGVVAAAWWHERGIVRGGAVSYWPWVVAAGLSVGPAYSIGLHSGIGAVIVLWLFSGGMFQGPVVRGQRIWALVALLFTHSVVFGLVAAGGLPDAGNVPIFVTGTPSWVALISHASLMGLYALAFFAGYALDRRHAALAQRADREEAEAARQEVELAAARDELDLALASAAGIFTGSTIGGYSVDELLGRGGMGEVYRATSCTTGSPVALKLVRGDRIQETWALELFGREAAAMARVRSPHVARVLAFGDGSEGGLPFIAMELIEGRSLADILRARETLSRQDARRMVAELASGLADVHEPGLVHCDLKPANVLLTDEGRWVLVDFGVAHAMFDDETDGRWLAGTPAYMAPEQCRPGARIDARADLYALCLLVYRALVGRPAYTGVDPKKIAALATEQGPPDPSPAVVGDLALALRIGLAADREDRFASAQELAAAFEAAFDGELASAYRERAKNLRSAPQTPAPV